MPTQTNTGSELTLTFRTFHVILLVKKLVRLAGIEPARRFKAADFKSAVATDYTTVATPYLNTLLHSPTAYASTIHGGFLQIARIWFLCETPLYHLLFKNLAACLSWIYAATAGLPCSHKYHIQKH